ncbi:protein kinase [Actinoplanes sp. NBC_00393]|uniref:serine/threonine-protein kinase n=1 Tax=Actinoplanes sp. NBC_00393 TaxID=2975953 RepID=UPI002E22A486
MTVSPLRPGDPHQIGTYRLLGRLGEGGMGSVFLGQSETGRRVAVKIVRPELAGDPEFRARFRSEVRRARQVPPFCTAEVLDADADHDTPYLVAELVEGPSLAEVVQERGPLAGGSLHSLAIGVATALVAIHDAGVVHRDLKPANVLFALAAPKVIDFGIAKGLGAADQHTEPGQVFGTIAYMGPERFDDATSRTVGPATDIFAWGAVITFAATGHTPFTAEEMIGTAAGLALPEPDLAGLPYPLRDLVELTLRPDPATRPTAHELLERLLRAGAAGNSQVRAGLAQRPELRRAAAAVRNTVRMVVPRRAPADAPRPSSGRPGSAPGQPGRAPRPSADRPGSALGHSGRALRFSAGRSSAGRSGSAGSAGRTLRRLGAGILAGVVALGCGVGLAVALPPERRAGGPDVAAPASSLSLGDRGQRASEQASRDEERPRCAPPGPVVLRPEAPAARACPAARNDGDWSVAARVALLTADACAIVRVRADTGAFRVTLCADRAVLEAETGRLVRMLAFQSLPPADPAAWRRVEVRADGTDLLVRLDERTVLTAPGATTPQTRGAVVFGMTPDSAVVTFTEITIEPA